MERFMRKMGICITESQKIMDTILEKLEVLIDDIERDSQLTKDEIYNALLKLKEEIEEHQLGREEGLQWEDLD
jgi:hypothetical protein